MSNRKTTPEYSDYADAFWRLGVMQSPSELHGRLVGQLVVGETITPELWLKQSRAFLDPVGDISVEDGRLLISLLDTTGTQVSGGEFTLDLLLPGDMFDINQRVEALGQWCQGFLAGFAMAGKAIKQLKGQQQYSAQLSETLSDMAAISQVGLSDERDDLERSEQDLFEISEYLRIAAISIYYECTNTVTDTTTFTPTSTTQKSSSVASPANLFSKKIVH